MWLMSNGNRVVYRVIFLGITSDTSKPFKQSQYESKVHQMRMIINNTSADSAVRDPENDLSTKLFQGIRLLFTSSTTSATTTPASPSTTPTSTSCTILSERGEPHRFLTSNCFCFRRRRSNMRQQILRNMLHMRLYPRRMQRLVVAQKLEVKRIVLKMGLDKLISSANCSSEKTTALTLSLSELRISVFSSLILASLMALLVTDLKASSIRYLKASTCFISKLYSLILLPLPPCSFSIFPNTASSSFALGKHPTTLFFPHWSCGTTNDNDIPVRPARAVRPTRWVYAREEVGKSKFRTQATSTKSTPRVTPYSLSPPLGCFRLRDFCDSGAGETLDLLRLRRG